MRIFFSALLTILFSLSCNSSSEAVQKKDTAQFTIAYSNDIIGYLEPCG